MYNSLILDDIIMNLFMDNIEKQETSVQKISFFK